MHQGTLIFLSTVLEVLTRTTHLLAGPRIYNSTKIIIARVALIDDFYTVGTVHSMISATKETKIRHDDKRVIDPYDNTPVTTLFLQDSSPLRNSCHRDQAPDSGPLALRLWTSIHVPYMFIMCAIRMCCSVHDPNH